jgi:hypothetical protein
MNADVIQSPHILESYSEALAYERVPTNRSSHSPFAQIFLFSGRRRVRIAVMPKKHIFVSYVHEDEADVGRLVHDLEARGEIVWWDQMILPGQAWDNHLQLAIRDSFAAIVCLSHASVARVRSGQFRELVLLQEVITGYSQLSSYIFPVRLDECEIPYYRLTGQLMLDQIEYTDLYPEERRAANLERLVQGLARAPERPMATRRN